MSALSWTPVKRGKIYCSPACGGKCKYSDYLAAKARAGRLAKRLGNGFNPAVWENMGWHWNVQCGKIEVWQSRDDMRFFANYDNQHHSDGSTPKGALEALLLETDSKLKDALVVFTEVHCAARACNKTIKGK